MATQRERMIAGFVEEFETNLIDALGRIDVAMAKEEPGRQASFSGTVEFKWTAPKKATRRSAGEDSKLIAKIHCRERIPHDEVTHELKIERGQLVLL